MNKQRLGLALLYIVIAGNAVLLLCLFIQILFRAAIERHRRRRFAERNGGAAYTLRRFDGEHGWANTWLPRNPEIVQAARDENSAGKLAEAAPLVKQVTALLSILIAFGLGWTVAAQQSTGREVSPSTLKQQLLELEFKETRIRIRLEELNEELKPESIERELAGVGSTHPEELREHRRKLLTIERNGLQRQLDLLEEDRARIEAAIATTGTAASLDYGQGLKSVALPLQKLSVAVGMLVLLGGGFIMFLIAATQKVEQRIVPGKGGSSGSKTREVLTGDISIN